MIRHVAFCAPAHDIAGAAPARLLRLRVEASGDPLYWLDVEIPADARLRALDRFLRDVWLECCGHMSAFTIGSARYQSAAADGGLSLDFLGGLRPRSMNARLSEVISPGLAFRYEYDFGSTTNLRLKVASVREGRIGRRPLRLLARNEPAAWQCATCSANAIKICTWCIDELDDPLFCEGHARAHIAGAHDDDETALLPVVNSPRMGVCGYAGPPNDRYEIRPR
jgi:hypothetical protein